MYVSLQQWTIANVYAMFSRQFIVCFLLEMATRLFLWGLLLHMAIAQVAVQHQAHWDQHQSMLYKTPQYFKMDHVWAQLQLLPQCFKNKDIYQCSSVDVQPTELHAEDQVSENEAATSVAAPGSSRQEKCKRENVYRGTGRHFARKRLCKNLMQSVTFSCFSSECVPNCQVQERRLSCQWWK